MLLIELLNLMPVAGVFVEGRPRSPPGDYCRIIPPKETRRRGGPPVLPPQLLEIVLNQEVPRHVSDTNPYAGYLRRGRLCFYVFSSVFLSVCLCVCLSVI